MSEKEYSLLKAALQKNCHELSFSVEISSAEEQQIWQDTGKDNAEIFLEEIQERFIDRVLYRSTLETFGWTDNDNAHEKLLCQNENVMNILHQADSPERALSALIQAGLADELEEHLSHLKAQFVDNREAMLQYIKNGINDEANDSSLSM